MRPILFGVLAARVVVCGAAATWVGADGPSFLEVPAIEALRAGNIDDPNYAFSRISSASPMPGGAVAAAHSEESLVRIFDEHGTLPRTVASTTPVRRTRFVNVFLMECNGLLLRHPGAFRAVIHRSERQRTEAATSSHRTWPTARLDAAP